MTLEILGGYVVSTAAAEKFFLWRQLVKFELIEKREGLMLQHR